MAPDDPARIGPPTVDETEQERGFKKALAAAGRVAILTAMPLAISIWMVSSTPQGMQLIKDYRWWALGLVLVSLILPSSLAAIPAIRIWIKSAPGQLRAGWMIFGVLPLVVGLVVAVVFLPPRYQMLALRVVYLLAVCLLPAILFFLFIATRKWSLLSEFLTNMDRLGVYGPHQEEESEATRRRRVDTYLQKFEALYGALDPEIREEALQPPQSRPISRARVRPHVGFVNLFTSEAAVPVVLATIVMAVVWLMVLPPWQVTTPGPADTAVKAAGAAMSAAASGQGQAVDPSTASVKVANGIQPWRDSLVPNLTPVTAAFLGAYFFSLQMLFRRYVRRDLRPSAYVGVTMRVLLSMIAVWIVERVWGLLYVGESGAATPTVGIIAVGFVIGVFPRVAWQLLSGLTKKLVPTAVLPSLQTKLPISDLDGLTVWHEARLEEEDIENVPNMATADLLDLMLNTRFPPDRVVDWVDQAILYTHLGVDGETTVATSGRGKDAGTEAPSRRMLLRAHGIRTASALDEVYFGSEPGEDRKSVEEILPGAGRSEIRSLVHALEMNPNLRLVRRWRGLPEWYSPMPEVMPVAAAPMEKVA
jgi:hypothetical protein